MANGDYLTPKQAAKLIGFTYHTLLLLDDIGQGPPERRSGTRPYHRDDLRIYQASLPDDINELLEEGSKPIFAQDDLGIWREIVTYSVARGIGDRRYFDGQRCRAGHIAERYTKNHSCSICSEIRAGRYHPVSMAKYVRVARILGITTRE